MMETWAVLATGESLTLADAERVRHLPTVAVSNAYVFAPWARALVASDRAWWDYYKPEFAGECWSAAFTPGIGKFNVPTGLNSGAFGIRFACERGARRILLLGFDGGGSHFFGPHPEPLRNTSPKAWETHRQQHHAEMARCKARGVEVWNCTPGTRIDAYPTTTLDAIL